MKARLTGLIGGGIEALANATDNTVGERTHSLQRSKRAPAGASKPH
jgi:hypothetical protein